MRNVPLFIAWRYLFARKSHNAINIVSGISAMGICVGTAAMICVLSVLNGFSSLIEEMFSAFNPEIRIEATEGKVFSTDTETFRALRSDPRIAVFSETIEETALAGYDQRQTPVILKGVDDNFQTLTSIDSIIYDGRFAVSRGDVQYAVIGIGVAQQIGIGPYAMDPLDIYTPQRTGKVSTIHPEKSFNQVSVQIAGTFSVQQLQYDDRYVLVSLPLVRSLIDYGPQYVSAVELRLHSGTDIRRTKRDIAKTLGSSYRILDRYEQQADYFRIVRIEKLLTFLLLTFILLIASFSVIGSLSMLMIDKKENIGIMQTLGAESGFIRRIFLFEGWLITLLGSLSGMVLGVVICLLQQTFGLLRLGNGTDYVVSAYPVQVQITDVLIVLAVVMALGFVTAWIPVRNLQPSLRKQNEP